MEKTWRLHGRPKPYTERGIRRLPCFRCGRRSRFQWSTCADGNLWRPICERCDIALNSLVLRWMGFELWRTKLRRYVQSIR